MNRMSAKNNNNGNQNNSNNSNSIIQQEEKQIINNSQDQLHHNSMLFRMGQYNYQLKGDEHQSNGFVDKLRKKFAPLRHNLYEYKLIHESSARRRRRIIYSSLFAFAFFCFLVGFFWTKKDILLAQTPMNQDKDFINGDTVRIYNAKYDKSNHMGIVYIDTSGGQNGGISMNKLQTSFRMEDLPQSSDATIPTIQVMPLYEDHYAIVIRHMYTGYNAMSIQLHDKNYIDQTLLSKTITNDNGTNVIGSPHINADMMTKRQVKILSLPSTSLTSKQYAKQSQLLNWIQGHNYQYLILGHQFFNKHKGKINPNLTNKSILVNIIKKEIKNNNADINKNNGIIKRSQNNLKHYQQNEKQLESESSLSPDNEQVTTVINNIKENQKFIAEAKQDIKSDQDTIKEDQDRLSQSTETLMNQFKPQPQQVGQQWSNTKGKPLRKK